MKNKILIIVCVVILLVVVFFIGTGLTKNPNVVIKEYSLNEDGSELTFTD